MQLVNVNFPEKPRGIRWTRQSVQQYDGKVIPAKDPMGRPLFWFTVTRLEAAEEGTDRWAFERLGLDHSSAPRPHRRKRFGPSAGRSSARLTK